MACDISKQDTDEYNQTEDTLNKTNVKEVDLDKDLDTASEQFYNETASKIIDQSIIQLNGQNDTKNKLRTGFSCFFKIFLSIQYAVLVVILVLQAVNILKLPTEIIITYISSVFVETLGGLIYMVKFAFEVSQEKEIVQILNNFLKDFKKHSDNR